jgi:Fe-S cluster assembly protein SufD
MALTTIREAEAYAAHLDRLIAAEARTGPTVLSPYRREAFARFAALGFPTTRDEEWKYTNVAPIGRMGFRAADRSEALQRPGIPLPHAEIAGWRLVFLNGFLAPELSNGAELPPGAWVGSLAALPAAEERIARHVARYAPWQERAFVALNTALAADGAYVYLPRGVVYEAPIHLLFLATGHGDPIAAHPRVLIVAEENSQATVIETYAGPDGSAYFTNSVTEITLGENAVLDHYRVQREGRAAFHIATQQLYQSRSSTFTSHAIQLGGDLVRNDVGAVLAGEGIECTLNGLYMASGRQHTDTHTVIDHAKPHCNSHELYKGILDGRSTGVFNGKILVRQDAQKTDAKQTNQNLLLSNDATINTKPQLEIFADDVRCTHGATVGQLDRDALFYLRSRGLGEAEARSLLTYAFASDILERIRVAPLREELEGLLFERVPIQ